MKKMFIGMSSLTMMTCLFISTACQNKKPVTEKVKLDITCVDCTIDDQREIHNEYALNDNVTLTVKADTDFFLPKDIDAKLGDKQLVKDTDYTYSKDSGELKFVIKGDTTITITAQDTPVPERDLNDYTWAEIKEISDSGKASETFTLGETKDIVVNNQTHEVRIIGFDQDVDSEGNKIGITFEFANILSDENGYSLAAYWNDTEDTWDNIYNYWDSTIRAVLNGKGTAEKKWFQYFGTNHDEDTNKSFSDSYSGKSVLNDMLPNDLKEVLTAPSKWVRVKNVTNAAWSEVKINDELFLLSPREMGCDDTPQESSDYTFTYSYYEDSESNEDKKIKHQVNSVGAREELLVNPGLDGKHVCMGEEYKLSTAGFEDNSDPEGHDFGGAYWLRSPRTDGNLGSCAWGVNEYGYIGGNEACLCASGIAPAFCI